MKSRALVMVSIRLIGTFRSKRAGKTKASKPFGLAGWTLRRTDVQIPFLWSRQLPWRKNGQDDLRTLVAFVFTTLITSARSHPVSPGSKSGESESGVHGSQSKEFVDVRIIAREVYMRKPFCEKF